MKDKKIKLLITEPSSDTAGVSQYILAVVRHLPADEFDVSVGIPGDGHFFEVLKENNIKAHKLPINYSALSFIESFFKLRKFLKSENFDIIHAHTAKAGFLCSLANQGLKGKIIYTGHGFRFDQKKNYLVKKIFFFFERFICKRSDFVTVLSDLEYNFGLKNKLYNKNKSAAVSMTIDTEKFSSISFDKSTSKRMEWNIPKDAFVIGMVGRITFQKDPETFINTASILKDKINNSYFVWVGDGDMRENIINQAKNLNIGDRIIMVGQQKAEEIPLFLSMFDVLLFTSRFEGLPISLLEAMASKKNIVAADVGSVSDIIKNNETGWTFLSGDYKRAASIIEDIYSNKEKYNYIRNNAGKLISDKYSPAEKIAKDFSVVYKKVLNNEPI